MNDYGGGDRRVAQRHKTAIEVEYVMSDGTTHRGTVENLSRNGVLLITQDKVAQHTAVKLHFPGTGGSTTMIEGKIVRFASAGAVGVAFVTVEGEALDFVRGLAEH